MATHRVQFSDEDIQAAETFAQDVVNETYDRLNQNMETRIFRLKIGKLGEIALLNYCREKDIQPNIEGMFEIYQGQTNVDKFDFVLEDGRTIDVKTGNQSFHRLIIVPTDQFEQQKKDIYVGVFVNVAANESIIHGYVTRGELANTQVRDRGEGPGYEWRFDQLHDIDEIINEFA